MTIDLSQFHQTFFEESAEGLDEMESGLLALEIGADNNETINTIFRGAHSIKGGAGTFGFDAIAGFTHVMETLMDEIRGGNKELTKEIVEAFLQSVDCLRDMMMVEQHHEEHDMDRVNAMQVELESLLHEGKTEEEIAAIDEEITEDEFEALLDQLHGDSGAPTVETPAGSGEFPSESEYQEILDQLPGGDDRGCNIRFKPHPDLMANGNDPLHILRELEGMGDLTVHADLSGLVSFDQIDPADMGIAWDMKLITDASEEVVKEAFAWVEGACDLEIKPFGNITEPADPAEKENTMEAKAVTQTVPSGEAVVESKPAVQQKPAPEKPVSEKKPAASQAPVAAANRPKAGSGGDHAEVTSIRVGIDKIDALINMVGELVITQSMLSQLGSRFEMNDLPNLVDGLVDLERNSRDLQEAVMRVRMVPISFAFARFPRLVRDLGNKMGKQFELVMLGETTELDKTVMEKIGDPLVHLVRNSLDHGIETPDVRKAAGKPETGTLTLSAYHQGGNIVIEIKDDGAGLNKEKILAKARERGLVDDDEVLSDDKVYELVMQAGFSTADTVSDVSGRGVGMDVVQRNISGLGGSIEISSEQGKCTTVTIRLPLTLAIVDGQIVRVGDQIYIVPLISIVETIQINDEQINAVAGKAEVLRLRESYIQIIRMYDVFSLESKVTKLSEGLLVVVEGDGQKAGLFVDELLGQQQVVIKSLESNYERVDGVSGATILGDGTVALIADVSGIIKLAHELGLTDRMGLVQDGKDTAAASA